MLHDPEKEDQHIIDSGLEIFQNKHQRDVSSRNKRLAALL